VVDSPEAPQRVWLAWSSGKDSAWALHVLRATPAVRVEALVTTLNEVHDRVAMHAVRHSLLRQQARALGLPLRVVPLPDPCPNAAYEARMEALLAEARAEGVTHMAFGDLFLEDVRAYRERQLAGTGVEPLFPLWGAETGALARRMVAAGLRAWITCVDPRRLPRDFAGRRFDASLLEALPPDVDPCGENGEFHSFVSEGPGFAAPLAVRPGEVVERDGFVFADVLPAEEAAPAVSRGGM
jgi:uncharacterized protein (TIGR00290 family)